MTHIELKRSYARAYYYKNRERILEANRAKKKANTIVANTEIRYEESGFTLYFD